MAVRKKTTLIAILQRPCGRIGCLGCSIPIRAVGHGMASRSILLGFLMAWPAGCQTGELWRGPPASERNSSGSDRRDLDRMIHLTDGSMDEPARPGTNSSTDRSAELLPSDPGLCRTVADRASPEPSSISDNIADTPAPLDSTGAAAAPMAPGSVGPMESFLPPPAAGSATGSASNTAEAGTGSRRGQSGRSAVNRRPRTSRSGRANSATCWA